MSRQPAAATAVREHDEPKSSVPHDEIGLDSMSASNRYHHRIGQHSRRGSALRMSQDFASSQPEGLFLMASASEPNLPRNRDREVPPRRGENIDEDKDKKPERDKVPDTPPTEPEPVPVEEPPRRPDKRGPYIVQFGRFG
jgi:hypothetical protein